MNRRQFFAVSSGAVAGAAFRDVLWAGQQPAAPTGEFSLLNEGVGIFKARGGTIGFLINDDAVVVVDTQYANTAPLCVEGLKEQFSKRTIDLVINTHHHADHTGGNGVFKASSKRILAHARVPELMKTVAAAQPATPAPVLPSATFEKTWSEKMGNETVSAKHYGPGHTGGDAVVFFERPNVVHMGDLLFVGLHPRVDRPGGASIQNWMKTLEAVAKEHTKVTTYIPGHVRAGLPDVTFDDELLNLRDYFDAVLAHVRKGMAAKKLKEEIVGLAVLPKFEKYQASGTVLTLTGVLTAAYEELTG